MTEPNDEILKLLSDKIKAENRSADELKRANDLKEEELRVARRRDAIWRELLERYADLGERVTGQTIAINEQTQAINNLVLTLHGVIEAHEETTERIERMDRALMLMVRNGEEKAVEELLGDGPERARARRKTAGIEREIEAHDFRLQELKVQRAMKGGNSPPELLVEIEKIESEIARLQAHRGRK